MDKIYVIADIKQKTGSLKVTVEGPIFIAKFSGACTLKIAQEFHKAVEQAQQYLPQGGWAYLSASTNYVAAVPEVEKLYTKTYELCMQSGCLVEAYCMPSKMGLAQVDKSRKACGVVSPIAPLSFSTINDAKYFLISTLAHIQEKRQLKQSV